MQRLTEREKEVANLVMEGLTNKEIDYAISKIGAVNSFLMQQVDEKFTFDETIELLKGIFVDG